MRFVLKIILVAIILNSTPVFCVDAWKRLDIENFDAGLGTGLASKQVSSLLMSL